MTAEEWAQQYCEDRDGGDEQTVRATIAFLIRAAVLEEREACAKMADNYGWLELAADMRARGEDVKSWGAGA